MAYKGKYKILDLSKYKGDPTQVIYRSLLERRFMKFCDEHSSILKWSYETVIIPYLCATDGRMHRYFVDFWIRYRDNDGKVKESLIEIKPFAQTQEPDAKRRKTKRYLQEALTYSKNISKWTEAEKFCKERGMTFKIITEKDLYLGKS